MLCRLSWSNVLNDPNCGVWSVTANNLTLAPGSTPERPILASATQALFTGAGHGDLQPGAREGQLAGICRWLFGRHLTQGSYWHLFLGLRRAFSKDILAANIFALEPGQPCIVQLNPHDLIGSGA